jgi:hypothetical protein
MPPPDWTWRRNTLPDSMKHMSAPLFRAHLHWLGWAMLSSTINLRKVVGWPSMCTQANQSMSALCLFARTAWSSYLVGLCLEADHKRGPRRRLARRLLVNSACGVEATMATSSMLVFQSPPIMAGTPRLLVDRCIRLAARAATCGRQTQRTIRGAYAASCHEVRALLAEDALRPAASTLSASCGQHGKQGTVACRWRASRV